MRGKERGGWRRASSRARTWPTRPRNTRTGANGAPTTRSARSTTPRPRTSSPPRALVRKGKVISLALNFDQHGPPGREEQVSVARPHQPAAHDAAHRNGCVFGRARSSRHPRRRRHGGDAAAMRHAVGRPRPRLLRELHVERLRLPRGDVRRRAEVRHREDQGEDGGPRRVSRRAARARQGRARRRLRHHLRRPRSRPRRSRAWR